MCWRWLKHWLLNRTLCWGCDMTKETMREKVTEHLPHPKRIKMPIERNPRTRKIELCLSGWWKWVAGIAATLVTSSIIAVVTMAAVALETRVLVGTIADDLDDMDAKHLDRLDRIDDSIARVREKPFTSDDALELEQRLRQEFRGR